jgi:hypothetical protein
MSSGGCSLVEHWLVRTGNGRDHLVRSARVWMGNGVMVRLGFVDTLLGPEETTTRVVTRVCVGVSSGQARLSRKLPDVDLVGVGVSAGVLVVV